MHYDQSSGKGVGFHRGTHRWTSCRTGRRGTAGPSSRWWPRWGWWRRRRRRLRRLRRWRRLQERCSSWSWRRRTRRTRASLTGHSTTAARARAMLTAARHALWAWAGRSGHRRRAARCPPPAHWPGRRSQCAPAGPRRPPIAAVLRHLEAGRGRRARRPHLDHGHASVTRAASVPSCSRPQSCPRDAIRGERACVLSDSGVLSPSHSARDDSDSIFAVSWIRGHYHYICLIGGLSVARLWNCHPWAAINDF